MLLSFGWRTKTARDTPPTGRPLLLDSPTESARPPNDPATEPAEMVFFNYSTMQMAAKIVYYGPGLCGKTTNLQHIYGHTSQDSRGEMVSLETETDRTLFFDLLPIDVGSIQGFNTRIQLYTVPGQVFYNTTRKLVLKGVDGVVFVADSQRAMLQANIESFSNLEENLAEIGLSTSQLPLVLQYNKRDLPDICTVEEMDEALNTGGWPSYEAAAIGGQGVFETLKGISKLTLLSLKKRIAESQRGSESESTSAPARKPAAPAATPAEPTNAPAVEATAPELTEAEAAQPEETAPEAAPPKPAEAAPAPEPPPEPAPVAAEPTPPAAVATPVLAETQLTETEHRAADDDASSSEPDAGNISGTRKQVDILAELEKIRRHTMGLRPQGTQRGKSESAEAGTADTGSESPHGPESAADSAPPAATNGSRQLTQDMRLALSAESLGKARRFTVRFELEDENGDVLGSLEEFGDLAGPEAVEKLLLQIALGPEGRS